MQADRLKSLGDSPRLRKPKVYDTMRKLSNISNPISPSGSHSTDPGCPVMHYK